MCCCRAPRCGVAAVGVSVGEILERGGLECERGARHAKDSAVEKGLAKGRTRKHAR